MTPKEIVAKFAHSLDPFDPIAGQPSDFDLTIIQEAVAPLLLHIPYDETSAFRNLISLIQTEAAYVARYGATFPEPSRVGAKNPSIDNDATAVVCASTEAMHMANRTGQATYKTTRRDTGTILPCRRR